MPRSDLDSHFSKIDALVDEINDIVPTGSYKYVQFRADLAGMLVVAIAATYETCTKQVMYEFASKRHLEFGGFSQRNFERLNSRIRVSDLRRYCKLFDPLICKRFNNLLEERRDALLKRVSKNVEKSYEQILDWRHDFAHAGIRHTTIEEAATTHMIGKRVLYTFDDAFNRP